MWADSAYVNSIGKYTETPERRRLTFQLIFKTAQPRVCVDAPRRSDHSGRMVLTVEREFIHYELPFEEEEVNRD